MNNIKINNKDFLKYLINKCPSNLSYILDLKLNKKSISIKIDKDIRPFLFNDFFKKEDIYLSIIAYLLEYLKEHNINPYFNEHYTKDYLKYKYEKLNIKYI